MFRGTMVNKVTAVLMSAGLVVMGVFVLPACAGYTIQKDGCGKGYDVYGSHPYLVATQAERTIETKLEKSKTVKSATFAIKYLPDYSRRYRVSSWAGFGKADFTFEFKDGWQLTKIADQADNTEVAESIAALVGLAKTILPGAGSQKAAAGAVGPKGLAPEPVLYRIEFDECGKVAGLTRIDVQTLPPPVLPCRALQPCQPVPR